MEDYNYMCTGPYIPPSSGSNVGDIIIIIILSVLSVIMIVILVYLCRTIKKEKEQLAKSQEGLMYS